MSLGGMDVNLHLLDNLATNAEGVGVLGVVLGLHLHSSETRYCNLNQVTLESQILQVSLDPVNKLHA